MYPPSSNVRAQSKGFQDSVDGIQRVQGYPDFRRRRRRHHLLLLIDALFLSFVSWQSPIGPVLIGIAQRSSNRN